MFGAGQWMWNEWRSRSRVNKITARESKHFRSCALWWSIPRISLTLNLFCFFYPKYFYQIFLMLRTIFNPHRVVFWEISLYICVPPSDWLMCTVVCFCCWTWSKLNLIRVKLGEAQFATRSTHHGCWLSLLYKIEMAINLDCVAVVALPWNGFKFELKTSHNLCNQQLKSDHQFN